MSNQFRDNMYESFPDPNKKIEELREQIDSQNTKVDTLFKKQFNILSYGAKAESEDAKFNNIPAIQAAINAAFNAGGGIVIFPTNTYTVDPTTASIRMRANVILEGKHSTIKRVGANATKRVIENYNYGAATILDKSMEIRDLVLIGTGDTVGISDQGHAIGFFKSDTVKLVNIKTDKTNGDGIAFREAHNVTMRDIEIGDFGRNGISPTSGRNMVWDNVHVIGNPYPGANGKGIDLENNSATETSSNVMNNVSAKDITFVDFYTTDGGVFGHEVMMNNCKFGPSYTPVRFLSTNKTVAKNVIIGGSNRIDVGGNGGAGLVVERVSGVSVGSCKIIKDIATATGSIKGVSVVGTVDSLFLNGTRFDGVDYSVQAYDTARLNNAVFSGCSLGNVYLGGSNNEFKGCLISTLTINGADSVDNIIDSSSRVTTITSVNSGDTTKQHFGSKRGTRSKAFYSRTVDVPDSNSTPYDLTIPLPDASVAAAGKALFLFAGWTHQGRALHFASLQAIVGIGSNTNGVLATINSNASAGHGITVLSVTSTSITLRLTYSFAGTFSATVLG
ncbi:tail fiber protein [Bacillus phage vB_BmeM-Goe8]|uniref:Uncharacterized protein n=1 Tax=Bacillus phage vB_BmeM-Goe8 TaxID=2593638 RepID=A0A516KN19_9CAUD|nr:tail fiber protein [Bacillus phage vB_BmeM-Goe8]QDP42975.1 hypothetical protein Goe8_c02020 [Bacillus phage vB_BmeM-Goe8]